MTEFDTPLYNLKMAVKATGLTAATLRAWERRYGMPSPERTAGRHRLYSRRDIETLRWLSARLSEGTRIQQAVNQWRAAVSEGRDPLAELKDAGFVAPAPNEVLTLESAREKWLEACKRFDETAAEQILDRAFETFPLEQTCLQVLQGGLRQIGEEWFAGKTSVQQEHFTSALAVRRLQSLFASSPQATRPQTVLVGCPSGEWHNFAPLLLVLLLRRRGLHVIYLGADLPGDQMIETARETSPDLVVLTAQTLSSAASLLPAAQRLQSEGIQVAFGGWIFTRIAGLSEKIPGEYLGDDLEAAALLADRLSTKRRALPDKPPILKREGEFTPALNLFIEKRALIEMSVLQNSSLSGLELKRLWAANLSLGNNLQAALELGDIHFLALDLRWISDLLSSTPDALRLLNIYLRAYRQALQEYLGEQGRVVVEWDGWENPSGG